jgi:hypothetical protein
MTTRLEEAEKEIDRHDKTLEQINTGLIQAGKDVHEIRIMFRERDNTMSFLRNVFLALLGIGLVQVASSIWFSSALNATVSRNTGVIADIEARLRANEKEDFLRHKTNQSP